MKLLIYVIIVVAVSALFGLYAFEIATNASMQVWNHSNYSKGI